VVEDVDETHCQAEYILLLVQEAVHRFRRLAGDTEQLLRVEFDLLEKRTRVVKQSNISAGKRRESSLRGMGRLFHQQTLEMERYEVARRLKSSRTSSPETAPTPGSDRSASPKRTMKPGGSLILSKTTAMLFADSNSTSNISRYISSRSLAKRRLREHDDTEFPTAHRAFLFGTEQKAQSCLKRTDGVDFFNRNIAHVAAEKGRIHLLKAILLPDREKLDTRDAFHLTPLIIAVMHGHLDSCKLLIEANFKLDRDSTGRNLLGIAVRRGHCHIMEYLLNDLRFCPDDVTGTVTCPPLHDAIASGNLRSCRLLLQAGADVNTAFDNKTPLTLASEKRPSDIWNLINEAVSMPKLDQIAHVPAQTGVQYKPNQSYIAANDVDSLLQQPYGQAYNTTSFSSLGPPHQSPQYPNVEQLHWGGY